MRPLETTLCQSDFALSRAHNLIYVGGRRQGKTYALALRVLAQIEQKTDLTTVLYAPHLTAVNAIRTELEAGLLRRGATWRYASSDRKFIVGQDNLILLRCFYEFHMGDQPYNIGVDGMEYWVSNLLPWMGQPTVFGTVNPENFHKALKLIVPGGGEVKVCWVLDWA